MVLFAHGPMFTSGLDILDVFPRLGEGKSLFPAKTLDPWGTHGRERTKPLVTAIHGKCLTARRRTPILVFWRNLHALFVDLTSNMPDILGSSASKSHRLHSKILRRAFFNGRLTLGIELALAGDVVFAAKNATFAQIEIERGIFPFGGGTAHWIQTALGQRYAIFAHRGPI